MPNRWRVTALASLLATLVAGAGGCYGGDLGLVIDDDHDGPCCSEPPPGGPLIVDLAGFDDLDGFVEPGGFVHLYEGLVTTDAGTVAFASFDLSRIPPNARIRWADLVLTNAWWSACCGTIELDVSTVPYGNALDSGDPSIAGYDTVAFSLGAAAEGAAVTLDVSALVATEVEYGTTLFQVRLDSFGGDLGFEDAGGNLGLGTGLAPILTVSYD